MKKNIDLGLLIIRLILGISLLLYGIAKIRNGITGIEGMLSGAGIPSFVAYGVYIGEVLAPLMLIAGFRTRIGALLMILNFIVIIIVADSQNVFKLNQGGGWAIDFVALYLFGSLALFFTGAGRYAVSSRNTWD